MSDVTRLLEAVQHGDARAGEELLPLVYAELRPLARAKMAREQPGHTLQPTALTGGKVPYEQIAARLNLTEGAVRVAVHRVRQRYRDIVRAEIAETVSSPAEVDAEMQHLFAALSA